ncbi:hypothetical protein D3C81_1103590 [compost metagenome]
MPVPQHVDAHQRALDQAAKTRLLGHQFGAGVQLGLHVEAAADVAVETAIVPDQRFAVQLHPVEVARPRAQAQARREALAETIAAGPQQGLEQMTVLLMDRLPPAFQQAVRPAHAGELQPGGIHVHTGALGINPPDRAGDAVEQVFVVIPRRHHPLHQRGELGSQLAHLVVAQQR